MLDYDLTRAEQVRRTDLAQKARRMILSHMKVEAEDETSLTLDHRGYGHRASGRYRHSGERGQFREVYLSSRPVLNCKIQNF